MSHIATNNTFFKDAPIIDSNCTICGHVSKLEIGWIGMRCQTCKAVFDPFEMTMPDIVRMRRETLKLSRKEIAKMLNYKKSSVKKYELSLCTNPYFEATKTLINSVIK